MNFRDCHAKISSVDAQATLGDGVVVQVSGELSNDGHPMRRFTQTFVLACQSPKKYYVHNDIFRYQDMYNEEDDARVSDDHDNNESNVTTSTDSTGSVIVQPTAVFYQHPPGNVVVTNPTIISYPQGIPQGQAPAQVNGVIHDEILNLPTQTPAAPQAIIPNAPPTVIATIIAPAATALPMPIEPVAVVSPEVNQVVPAVIEVHQFEAEIGKENLLFDIFEIFRKQYIIFSFHFQLKTLTRKRMMLVSHHQLQLLVLFLLLPRTGQTW